MAISDRKERPILFSGPMVCAILAGEKTQTRRVVKPQPWTPYCKPRLVPFYPDFWTWNVDPAIHWPTVGHQVRCPFGVPGDRLWVRETHAIVPATAYRMSREEDGSPVPHRASPDGHDWAVYRQGWTRCAPRPWRPSIHMPRWASRLMLEVTAVRVERLQNISETDAIAEGIEVGHHASYTAALRELWDKLNAKRGYSWESNPWVWIVEFQRLNDGR